MAKNTGKNHRTGSVKNRTQTYNPKTQTHIKRDTKTGRFMDVNSDGSRFKGVAKEVDKRRT